MVAYGPAELGLLPLEVAEVVLVLGRIGEAGVLPAWLAGSFAGSPAPLAFAGGLAALAAFAGSTAGILIVLTILEVPTDLPVLWATCWSP